MAAVLAAGRGAVLSHSSAGALWGLLDSRRNGDAARIVFPIHVTVNGHAGHREGIRVHRSQTLAPAQTSIRWNIPVTNPSRTLLDLRRTIPKRHFDQALRQAEYLGLPIEAELDPDHTRSELEARLLAVCRRHRLPKPEVNVRIGPHRVDFLWRDARLVVEVDGYRAHGSREAFEQDRARDVHLRLRGYEVLRFTWRQLVAQPVAIARAIRGLL
jgi:very-short-patch-repair endonuclease